MDDLRVEGGDDELSRVARIIGLLGQHLGYCCPILHETQAPLWTKNGYNACIATNCVAGLQANLRMTKGPSTRLCRNPCSVRKSLDGNKNLFRFRPHAQQVLIIFTCCYH